MKTKQELFDFVRPGWLYGIVMAVILIILGILSAVGGVIGGLIVMFVLALIFLYIYVTPVAEFKRYLIKLEEDGELEQALEDFTYGTTYQYGNVICGKTFMMYKKSGTLIKYTDLVKVYQRIERSKLVLANKALIGQTKDNKTVILATFTGSSNAEAEVEMADVVKEIRKRNFGIKIGFR